MAVAIAAAAVAAAAAEAAAGAEEGKAACGDTVKSSEGAEELPP
jgi:hypothetical protein